MNKNHCVIGIALREKGTITKFFGINGWSQYDKVNVIFKPQLQPCVLNKLGKFEQRNFYEGNLLETFPPSMNYVKPKTRD